MQKLLDFMDKYGHIVVIVLFALVVIATASAFVFGDATVKWNEPITTMTKGEFICIIFLVGICTRGK